MPDSPNGTYTLPPSYKVDSGDTSDISQHNPPFEDLAQAMTDRLHRDGRTSWTGNQNANGFKLTGLAAGTNSGDAVTMGQLGTSFSVPVGVIVDYGGATAPDNWLLCHGQAVSRTGFPLLFAAIGTTHGIGDGTTTFNIPDLRGRVVAGLDNMGGTDAARLGPILTATTLGSSGGVKEYALTEAQMPSHTHTVTDPGHTHTVTDPGHRHTSPTLAIQGSPGISTIGNGGIYVSESPRNSSVTTTGISLASGSTGITITARGGGAAHPNVQPTMVLNKIIKAR